jgi:hypothetical protein
MSGGGHKITPARERVGWGGLGSSLGGDPAMPPGSPPAPDCCTIDEDGLPDRAASESGAYMVALSDPSAGADLAVGIALTQADNGTPDFINNAGSPTPLTHATDGNDSTYIHWGTLHVTGGGLSRNDLFIDLGSAEEIAGFRYLYQPNKHPSSGGDDETLTLAWGESGSGPWHDVWTDTWLLADNPTPRELIEDITATTAQWWRMRWEWTQPGLWNNPGPFVYSFELLGAIAAAWNVPIPAAHDGDDDTY